MAPGDGRGNFAPLARITSRAETAPLGIHSANRFPAVAFDKRGDRQLHSREDHTAVVRTGAPAECFGSEHRDVHAAFRECSSSGKDAVTASDCGDVNGVRETGRGGYLRRIDSGRPEILLMDGHGTNWRGEILALDAD
jgi:hypothetical protein